mgnify:CR=1 FL=1
MSRPNAPLTVEGRGRVVVRIASGVLIAHVAAQMGVSRVTASKWWHRYEDGGGAGLGDRSSRPQHCPGALEARWVEEVEGMRRAHKWSGPDQLPESGSAMGWASRPRAVGRWLERLGISRRRDLDPTSMPDRVPGVIGPLSGAHGAWMSRRSAIPTGGGWRVHGRGTDAARASRRGGRRAGYTYLHSMIDGFSRLVTDNGSAYRSTAFNDAVRDLVGRRQVHVPLHAAAQRQSRALQPDPGRGVPLRPSIHQRGAAKRRAGPMARPLQLPPTPHRHGGQPTRQPRPHPHKQRHTLIQLAPCATVLAASR